MKASDRDNLLTRVDERTNNIWRSVEKLEKHQGEQNGFIKEALVASSKNTAWRKILVCVASIGVPILIVWLSRLQGLW